LFGSDSETSTAVFVLNCAMPIAGLLALPLGMLLFKLPIFAVFAIVAILGLVYSSLNFVLNSVAQYIGKKKKNQNTLPCRAQFCF
jgi:uncharacterized membrane protein